MALTFLKYVLARPKISASSSHLFKNKVNAQLSFFVFLRKLYFKSCRNWCTFVAVCNKWVFLFVLEEKRNWHANLEIKMTDCLVRLRADPMNSVSIPFCTTVPLTLWSFTPATWIRQEALYCPTPTTAAALRGSGHERPFLHAEQRYMVHVTWDGNICSIH